MTSVQCTFKIQLSAVFRPQTCILLRSKSVYIFGTNWDQTYFTVVSRTNCSAGPDQRPQMYMPLMLFY